MFLHLYKITRLFTFVVPILYFYKTQKYVNVHVAAGMLVKAHPPLVWESPPPHPVDKTVNNKFVSNLNCLSEVVVFGDYAVLKNDYLMN